MHFDQLRRREFISLLGGAAATWPLAVRAQQPGRTYRLGVLNSNRREVHVGGAALFAELRNSGFVEGDNLTVDERGYGVNNEQFPRVAVELVDSNVDVILCGGPVALRAAQQATKSIPILGVTDDMVGAGFAHSLAKPGGNTTGVTILATELDGKRQEILIELLAGAWWMAALVDLDSTAAAQVENLKNIARSFRVDLLIHVVARPEDIGLEMEKAKASGAAALNNLASPMLNAHRRTIIEHAAVLRLPAIYQFPETVEQGGLIGYGPRASRIYGQIARQLVKLLRGARPADLPVEQPTTFDLAINLKTAKALGLEVPPTLLARADEVIE
jgi:putative tryptophan/tyrosine transport system substrate-binding protein